MTLFAFCTKRIHNKNLWG